METHRCLRKQTRPARGFTLVEVVMVMVLLGILAAIGAPMIANSMLVANSVSPHLNTLSQARYATERIARELREVNWSGTAYAFTSLASPTSVTFTNANGAVISLAHAASNVNITFNGTARALTAQASAFVLTYLDITGTATADTAQVRFVNVSLTVLDPVTGATYNQRTLVALRNGP
jgi:prepilin-type N-terminal cleavage/methylation domain-containing protein